jgi:small subunit ribosomal protein S13
MARILGVDLPRNKRVDIGLTYIFGIGMTSANQILKTAKVLPSTRCVNLTDQEITRIRFIIDENYQGEGDLRRVYFQDVKRLTEIGSARGRRHRVGLPVRGQRTRTNARTRKRKIRTPVSKKK